MTCPTVIRVTTGTGPPGIGLPAGTGDAGKFVQKDGANPYQYRLVTPDQVGLPQGLSTTSSPAFAGLTLSGLTPQVGQLLLVGANGQLTTVLIGSNLSITNGTLNATGGGSGGGGYPSLSMPTGFSVTGSGGAAIAVTFAAGYSLPNNTIQASWTAGAALAGTAVQEGDVRLTDAREWSASTMSQSEAEDGTATVRRATTAQRLRQAAAAWWLTASGAVGRTLAGAATQAEGRTALGLGSAATADSSAFATPAALSSGLEGKADLVGGVVPSSQIPAIAISEYLGAVASQAAMLALTGQRGDWCLRTDSPAAGMWVLSGDNAALLANWVQIPVPTVPVQSVNGQTGIITLGAGDVGAATAAQGALAATAIQPGNSALSDSREWSATTISQAEAEAGSATTRRAFTALRVFQAVAAYISANFSAVGQALATAATAAAARTTLGAAGSGAIGSSELTMNTNRILLRSTAGAGAVEEGTLSGALSLSGTTLAFSDVIKLVVSNKDETATVKVNYVETTVQRACTVTGAFWELAPSATGSSSSQAMPYARRSGTKASLLSANASLAASAILTDASANLTGTLTLAAGDTVGVDLVAVGTGSSGHIFTLVIRYS